jgi:hypothetical protein
MTGKRQHILPRFLLKGFASRVEGREFYTWVYRIPGKIFETNIINVGLEKYFYGREGEISVDANITDVEGEYANLLDELREYRGQVEISDDRIAHFITHLVVRSKHIREVLRESSEFIVEKISDYLSDYSNIKAIMLGKYGRKELEKRIAGIKAPRYFRRKSRKFLKGILPDILDIKKNEMLILYQAVCESIKDSLSKMIKEGHIHGLSKGLTPEPRVEDYRLLRWFVCQSKV